MDDAVVYGKGSTEGIVAVESDSGEAVVWRRDPETGRVRSSREPFFPMMWFEGESYVHELSRDLRAEEIENPAAIAERPPDREAWTWTRLAGDLPRNHMVMFNKMDDFFHVYGDLRQKASGDAYLSDGAYVQTDDAQMWMMQSGETQFNGLQFDDIHRLQFDIEVISPSGGMPEPRIPSDEVIIIGVTDNRGYEAVLHTGDRTGDPFWRCEDEEGMMRAFVGLVQDLDPDVLEGHNVHDFDLSYLRQRCDMLGVDFAIGRDDRGVRHYDSMKRAANRYLDFECHDVYGRQVVDTMFQAYDWNVYARELDSFGLKDIARTLGVAAPERTYVDRSRMGEIWRQDPDRLLDYALDDVKETRAVAEELSAATFEKAKIIPIEYGTLNRTGTGREIESLMVREYLRQKHSLPKPEPKQDYGGAYTQHFKQGVYGIRDGVRVNNYDYSSLYPNAQMGIEAYPADDVLGVMPSQLEALTNLRIKHKEKMRSLQDSDPRKQVLDAQQDAEKVLINSYYGTLGSENFIFNDMRQAARITEAGQAAIKRMNYLIQEIGGHTLIECDTDGVWALNDGDGPVGEDLAEAINEATVEWLDTDLDADLDGIAMYKSKNYVKRDEGDLTFVGSAMTSSMFEKFGREFLQEGFDLLLKGEIQALHDLYVDYIDRIVDRKMPVEKLAKRETLRESYEEYRRAVDAPYEENGRTPDARYELAHEYDYIDESVGSTVTYYNAGDITSASVYEVAKPVEEYDGDENVKYYVRRRMTKFAEKFEPFFSEQDYGRMFPRPDRGEVRVERNDVSDVALVRRDVCQPAMVQRKLKDE